MRCFKFVEPNFSCDGEDDEGKPFKKLLFHFASEQELRSYLAEENYKVLRVRQYDFKTWTTRAEAADDLVSINRQKPEFKFNNALWTELKQYLFWLAKDKCGYCEQKVRNVYAGDVEHYRPKAKVTDDPAHPGYYWLAYRVSNYVPVCSKCNDASAKANHFPLEPGSFRATDPQDDVTKEKPLLLNPIEMGDPMKHFKFIGKEGGKDFGKFEGQTDAGRKSVELYRLNRKEVSDRRRELSESLHNNKKYFKTDWKEVTQQMIARWKTGREEFTFVTNWTLVEWFKEIKVEEESRHAEKIRAYEEQIQREKLERQELNKRIENDLKMLLGSN